MINLIKINVINSAFLWLVIMSCNADEPTLAQKLCDQYQNIKTITCEIRKTTKSSKLTTRMLSRVFYKNPDHIHVDIISPLKRTIIADGKNLYHHNEGASKGFSRPISELDETWLASLKNIPGTPMEHLLRLRNTPETSIPSTEEFPVRKGFQKENLFAVLSCDNLGRLISIEFFKSSDMKEKTGIYTYSEFTKIDDDCYVPCLHKGVLFMPDGEEVSETRVITNFEANKPIPDKMFDPSLFFKNIEFTGDFVESL